MKISLPPDLARLIEKKIASGQYHSASDVVREALLRLVNDRPREERLAELRRKIAEGVADSEAGRLIDGQTGIRLIEAKLKRLEKARRPRKRATG